MNHDAISPNRRFRSLCLLLALGGGFLLMGGCASVTARKVVGEPGAKVKALPQRVYVRDFAAPKQNLDVDRSGARLEAFQEKITAEMTKTLVSQLNRSFAPAKALPKGEWPKVRRAWLVTGRFDRVEQGSRALRAIFGLGLGGTKVVATSQVYDLSQGRARLLLTIQTSGGSNAMPGTVVTIAPTLLTGPASLPLLAVQAGTNAGPGALPGLGADFKRTAREITAVMSDYAYRRGLIFKKNALVPKPEGSGQVRIADPTRAR